MDLRAFVVVALSLGLVGASTGSATASADCPALTDSASSQALDHLVEGGNDQAAFCLASSLHVLDGGELEDALVALGRYGESKPVKLLLFAHRGVLAQTSLAHAVIMLPTSLSDDLKAQAAALEARRSVFTNIRDRKLRRERELALRSLASAITLVRSNMSNR